jgi:hypothetical protein
MNSRREFQSLHLRGHEYTLIVEISAATAPQWQAVATKEREKLSGPEQFASEAEAKKMVHQWAYMDAGINNHFCDGNCSPWKEPQAFPPG